MTEDFSPRTVTIVALASLVGGFVAVFGGGMLILRARPMPEPTGPSVPSGSGAPVAPSRPPTPSDVSEAVGPSVFDPVPVGDLGGDIRDSAAVPVVRAPGDGATAPVALGGVTITPATVSRCFLQGSTVPIPSAACEPLPALDQHMISKAAEIAGCTHAHGRLSLIMDFRFSTSFARAWGGPSSTVTDAGTVAACVRRVTAPLPLATIAHTHDRYIVVYGIDW